MKTVENKSSKLAQMSVDALKALLQKCLDNTLKNLRLAAQIVKVLTAKGVDLADIDPTMLGYLRRIGDKQLLPEFFLAWREKPVFNYARNLPLSLQKAVIENKPLEITVLKESGADSYLCEPKNMNHAQAAQVFARDHIRDKGEQISWLRSKQATKAKIEPETLPYTILKNKVHFHRNCVMTVREIRALLKTMTN